jgi:hypothetical protein
VSFDRSYSLGLGHGEVGRSDEMPAAPQHLLHDDEADAPKTSSGSAAPESIQLPLESDEQILRRSEGGFAPDIGLGVGQTPASLLLSAQTEWPDP